MSAKEKAKRVVLLGLDGADPKMLKKFMDQGRLPNLKKMTELGTTTQDMSMMSVMPTITPPNWASLATGAWPGTHGITCFWNHTTGNDLMQLENGFSSKLCEAEFIWDSAVKAGKKCIVFCYPTSWPPTQKENLLVVDGTGISVNTRGYIEYDKICQCEEGDFPIKEIPHDTDQSGANCMVEGEIDEKKFDVDIDDLGITDAYGGGEITPLADERIDKGKINVDVVISPIKQATGWKNAAVGAKEAVITVNRGQQRRFTQITAEDGKTYNKIELYVSKQDDKPIGAAYSGQWSQWIYDTYKVAGKSYPVAYKVKLISMEPDGSKFELYISFILSLNTYKWFYPEELAKELLDNVGPMMHMSACGRDEIMLETQAEMYDWYTRALLYLADKKEWDLIYTHVHALDFANHKYQDKILPEHSPDHEKNLELLCKYYEISDKFVGNMLKLMDGETLMVVVSDHGGMSKESGYEIPLLADPWSVGGKVLEELGYLVVKRENGKAEVDWEKTRAICQRSGYIYVNLKGRDPHGCVDPADYDRLVEKIIDDLYAYRDKQGRRPISFALNKDDMPVLGLYGNHVGDIYFSLNAYCTRVHGTILTTGHYKGTSVGALFMMAGPGVKKGHVIKRPVRIVDIVPSICHLTGIPVTKNCEGGIIYQAMEDLD